MWSIKRFRQLSIGRSALAPVTEVTVLPGNRVQVSTSVPFAPLLMSLTWWRTINGDADSAISIFTKAEMPPKGNNIPLYANEEFERLYAAQQVETDEAKRQVILQELQRVLMYDLPALPLYRQPQFWAVRSWVKGFEEVITPLSTLRPLYQVRIQ